MYEPSDVPVIDEKLITDIFAPSAVDYEAVVDIGTFGLDNIWKNETIKRTSPLLEQQGIVNPRILDLASGTGRYTSLLNNTFNPEYIVGTDITPTMVDVAKQRYPDIDFKVQAADSISFPNKFDLITSWYVPKYSDARKTVEGAYNALEDGGILFLSDFTTPKNPVVKFVYDGSLKFLEIIAPVFPNQQAMFTEVPKILRNNDWVSEYENAMDGLFEDIEIIPLFPDGATVISGIKY